MWEKGEGEESHASESRDQIQCPGRLQCGWNSNASGYGSMKIAGKISYGDEKLGFGDFDW